MSNRLVGTEIKGNFGIPYATNANGVIINQNKLDELGLAIPTTYTEFIAALEIAKEQVRSSDTFHSQRCMDRITHMEWSWRELSPRKFC